MLSDHVPAWTFEIQLVVAGIALHLAAERLLRAWRVRDDRVARWQGAWALSLALVFVTNVAWLHLDGGWYDPVLAARTVAMVAATLLIVPVTARLGGWRLRPRAFWALGFLGVLRVVLWIGTDAVYTHRRDAQGAPIYGSWMPLFAFPVVVVLAALVVMLWRRWPNRSEQTALRVGVVGSFAMGVATTVVASPWSEVLVGYWLLPMLAALFVAATHRQAADERAEQQILAQQAFIADELVRSETRNRLALQSGPMGWWEYDTATGAIAAAPELWEVLGEHGRPPRDVEEALGRVHPDDLPALWALIDGRPDRVQGFVVRWCPPGASSRWVEFSAAHLEAGHLETGHLETGHLETGRGRVVGLAVDITDRTLAEQAERHRASHDLLTGCVNREALTDAVAAAVERGESFHLLVVDIDRFTDVNVSLGHGAGDEVLQGVSRRFAWVLRRSDVLARSGGDEFAVLVGADDEGRLPDADATARQLVDALRRPFDVAGVPIVVQVSIGIVSAPADGADAGTLRRRADLALYRAQRRGGGAWEHFDAVDERAAQRRLRLAGELGEALRRSTLELRYRPRLELAGGRVRSAEATVRWDHRVEGVVAHADVVGLAGQHGLELVLAKWVLEAALAQLSRWRDDDLLESIAVDLPARLVVDPEFVPMLAGVLARAGVPPRGVSIEIGDGVEAELARLPAVLGALRELGVRVAVDISTNGYASILQLREIHADLLKFDRSFSHPLGHDTRLATTVGLAIGAAHRYRQQVLACEVDDQAALEVLCLNGCDAVQGDVVRDEASADELSVWLQERAGSVVRPAAPTFGRV